MGHCRLYFTRLFNFVNKPQATTKEKKEALHRHLGTKILSSLHDVILYRSLKQASSQTDFKLLCSLFVFSFKDFGNKLRQRNTNQTSSKSF